MVMEQGFDLYMHERANQLLTYVGIHSVYQHCSDILKWRLKCYS